MAVSMSWSIQSVWNFFSGGSRQLLTLVLDRGFFEQGVRVLRYIPNSADTDLNLTYILRSTGFFYPTRKLKIRKTKKRENIVTEKVFIFLGEGLEVNRRPRLSPF